MKLRLLAVNLYEGVPRLAAHVLVEEHGYVARVEYAWMTASKSLTLPATWLSDVFAEVVHARSKSDDPFDQMRTRRR